MKLATRYFAAFAALATGVLVTVSAIDVTTQYRENVDHIGELQRAEAHVVATRIDAYLDTLTLQLREVGALPWSSGLLDTNDRRYELERLLKLNAAIFELRFITPQGRERVLVSRLAHDHSGDGPEWPLQNAYAQAAPVAAWYGPVYFREGSTPYVSIAVRGSGPSSDTLVAEVNLRYVTDLIAGITFGRGGRAFVIDSTDHLIAHPNLSFVHRKVNLASAPQVGEARSADAKPLTLVARSPESGLAVLTSAELIATPGWLVLVEQPLEEVMQPVRASVYRAVAVLVLMLLGGMLASRWLATKLTKPIVELEHGAKRIASGDLSARVPVANTADEVQALGTEFNRMAENLARSYAELESKVQTRTQELADASRKVRAQADELARLNEQLQLRLNEVAAKKEEAERANAAKTRFLAAASHDLRQPMQAISLLVEVLRERIPDRESGLVQKVQASVQGLETLFVSLLDISRLDAGAIQAHVQEFPINSLLRLIEATFLPQAIAKDLKLKIVPCDGWIRTDPALLERILGNLVSNAIRYTTRGRILVGCRRHAEHLRVLVIDTGPGIPAAFHDDIFEEFFQLGNPERDRTKGLGLGLSIVKRTAGILQHALIVRSDVGRGSTFGVEVPLVTTHTRHVDNPALIARDPRRFAGMFVVIIDDDKDTRYAIEALCTQWGCHIVGASTVQEATDQLQHHLRSPDFIITDYCLPNRETGFDAVARVRQMAQEDIPAIIVTGEMSVRLPAAANGRGVALLYKPINAEQLWTAADQLLRAGAVAQDSQS